MKEVRRIELLAPARNLECGIEAVNHGADAVYIGAPKFGARAAAGNSIEDLQKLVAYAHLYRVRIYVTLNTILKDEELEETEKLIWQLYRIGVDALIVQDMGITMLHLPPIPLHASTQMDNRTIEKVQFLHKAGFRQVVLARELTLEEIREIHEACPKTPLEVFVHGALCVSYSGQCYASQACFGRSANRGECAQFCRLPFHLEDANGKHLVEERHLLSLKDMNQLALLEELLDAGVTSLKIEGRLKDVGYVKNVTAAYRQALDKIFQRRKEYMRASSGISHLDFQPQLEKSFNRGFTHYFLEGRTTDISNPYTPKSMGEPMGKVKERHTAFLTVSGIKPFHNGDGVCYIDESGKLQGFRVNKVEGNRLFPQGEVPKILPRTPIFRNYDQDFERLLARPSAERKLQLSWKLAETPFGFSLTATDEDDGMASLTFELSKEPARSPQLANLQKQLCKLGNTPFETSASQISVEFTENWFIPSSTLSEWRRQVIEELLRVRKINYPQEVAVWQQTSHAFPATELTYLGNVMNDLAVKFYQQHGVGEIAPAFERQAVNGATIMFTRHCIRYSLGGCPKYQQRDATLKEPLFLRSMDGKRFKLTFDCQHCQMKVSLMKEGEK